MYECPLPFRFSGGEMEGRKEEGKVCSNTGVRKL